VARRVGSVRGGARRPVEWLGTVFGPSLFTGTANTFFTLATAGQLSEYIHPTIVRVRGVIVFSGEGAFIGPPTVAPPVVTLGIAVVTDQAVAGGSLPVAAVDLDASWLYWEQFGFDRQNSISATDALFAERIIDSKAMRRIDQPDNAGIVMPLSVTMGAAGNLRLRGALRMLIKGD